MDDNDYKLVIPKSALTDSGTYSVEISNPAGSANSQGQVTVEPPIHFLKPLKDQDCVEGERVEFTCETNTKPHTIKWYRNGQELSPDNRIEFKTEGNNISLIIKWATKEDQGTWKVVLTNSCGPAESSANLNVRKAVKEPPKILRGLENQIVAKGSELVFEAKIEGADEVYWIKDGQRADKATSAIIEKVDDTTYRLRIPAAEVSDAGNYQIVAKNDDGEVKSAATAEVDEKPEIVKGLIPAELNEGDEHVFRVEVSAPVREVKWYNNGKELSPSAKLVLKQVTSKKYELLIPSAALNDAGEYKVKITLSSSYY